jgi:hypothetical protein
MPTLQHMNANDRCSGKNGKDWTLFVHVTVQTAAAIPEGDAGPYGRLKRSAIMSARTHYQ